MTHLDSELKQLRIDLLDMFELVLSQLDKSKEALVNLDKDLAREVLVNEKRVNSFELQIDRDCENIIALFNPVAVDLRFLLAVLKINSNLERVGDIAESVCQFVMNFKLEPEKKLLEASRLLEMFDVSKEILKTVKDAFELEDTKLARSVFTQDETLDEININAHTIIADYILTSIIP